jgi:hypothetical protein
MVETTVSRKIVVGVAGLELASPVPRQTMRVVLPDAKCPEKPSLQVLCTVNRDAA